MSLRKDPSKPTFIETARRAQIIACTVDALAELGCNKASMAQIAQCASIAKSVVHSFVTDLILAAPVIPGILPETVIGSTSAARSFEVISDYVVAFFDEQMNS